MYREVLITALKLQGQRASDAGIKLEVSIYGGAAFLLAFNSRDATRDVDAILKPKEEGERLVIQVARELDIPEDWLNSNMEQFISPTLEAKRRLANIEDETGLVVHVPTSKYLLAMKALACRRPIGDYKGDIEDLSYLIQKIGINSVAEIQDAVDGFYPNDVDVIRPSDEALLQSLIESKNDA